MQDTTDDRSYLRRLEETARRMTTEHLQRALEYCELQRFPTAAEYGGIPYTDLKNELRRRMPDADATEDADSMLAARIPPQYHSAELDDFEPGIAEKVRQFVDGEFATLLLHGPNGTGKTRALYAIQRECIRRRIAARVEVVSEMLRDLRAGFAADDEARMEKDLRDFDGFLMFDELGEETSSEYTRSVLGTIINSRERWGKPLAIATNLGLDEISDWLSRRVSDRLAGGCVILMDGPSFRWERQTAQLIDAIAAERGSL